VEVGSAAFGAVNKSDGCTFWHVGRPIAERPAFALMKMDLLAWAAAQLSVPEFMLWRQVPPMPRCHIPIRTTYCLQSHNTNNRSLKYNICYYLLHIYKPVLFFISILNA